MTSHAHRFLRFAPLVVLLLGSSSQASVLPGCSDSRVAEVPFEVANHHLVILGSINGSRPIKMVLDTGMVGGVMLNDDLLAQEIGLNATGVAVIGGAGEGGRVRAGIAQNVKVEVGALSFDDMTAIIIPSDTEYAKVTRNSTFEGVIGYSVFNRYVVCVDHQQSKLVLADPAQFQYQGAGRELPISIEGTKPYIRARARLTEGEEIDIKLVVDTGATATLYLNPESHPSLKIPERNFYVTTGRGVSGKRHGRVSRIQNLQLAGYDFPNLLVSFPDQAIQGLSPDRQGLLGNRVLNRFHSIFDYSRKRIILEPNDRFPDPFEFSMAGLGLYPQLAEGEGFPVEDVIPDSPAAEAGVQPGDLLAAVDGRPASGYQFTTLRDLFEAGEGKEYNLAFLRDGERFEVRIRLKRLL